VVATIDDHPRGYRNLLMRKGLGPNDEMPQRATAAGNRQASSPGFTI